MFCFPKLSSHFPSSRPLALHSESEMITVIGRMLFIQPGFATRRGVERTSLDLTNMTNLETLQKLHVFQSNSGLDEAGFVYTRTGESKRDSIAIYPISLTNKTSCWYFVCSLYKRINIHYNLFIARFVITRFWI